MKISFIINCSFSAWLFRKGLMKSLVQKGYDVTLIAPKHDKYNALVRSIGVRYVPVEMHRFTSPISDIKLLFSLYRVLRREQPDIVHNFTIKPNIYGTIAAKIAGVKWIVCSVTGLGYVYGGEYGIGLRILRSISSLLYRISFTISNRISFQNDEDLRYFLSKKIVARSKAVVIRSSGVNLEEYNENLISEEQRNRLRGELGLQKDSPVVLMVARANWSKGVREFVEASKIVKHNINNSVFILVGGEDEGPQAVPGSYLKEQESDHFHWLGFREDVKQLMSIASTVVLPSYYREGVPRCLLEAMAMQRSIVTTDNVGCRDVVEHGRNGLIVPIKDHKSLAKAVVEILTDENHQKTLGEYSRTKVENEFSEQMVVQKTITELYQIA